MPHDRPSGQPAADGHAATSPAPPPRPVRIPFARAPLDFDAAAPFLKEAIDNGWLTTGPLTERFTAALGAELKTTNLIAVSSCTAALQIALAAADLPDDAEVIVPANTFIATFETVELAGFTPVLADMDAATWNVSVETLQRCLTERTKAIIVVPFAGNPPPMQALREFANRHNLVLILDCAHALESTWQRQPLHTYADYSCFSFYATKNLTTAEGGAIVCPADKLELVRALSLHGMSRAAWKRYAGGNWRYDIIATGFKANLTDIHAALGLAQLPNLRKNHARRLELAEQYTSALQHLPLALQQLSSSAGSNEHARHLFCISVKHAAGFTREDIMSELAAHDIGFSVHFIPLYEFSSVRKKYAFSPANFPATAAYFQGALSLPLYPTLTDAQQKEVISAVRRVAAGNAAAKAK